MLGTWLKRTRQAKGLSQVRLSYVAEVPQATISDIENGKALPSIPTLQRLCQALGYELPWVTGRYRQRKLPTAA